MFYRISVLYTVEAYMNYLIDDFVSCHMHNQFQALVSTSAVTAEPLAIYYYYYYYYYYYHHHHHHHHDHDIT